MFNLIFYAQDINMKNKIAILVILIIFMMFSLVNIYANSISYIPRQIMWFGIGFFIIFLLYKIPRRYVYKSAFMLYVILNFLLLYLLMFGDIINGSRAWINLGFMSFQPSELMKVVLIVLLSIIVARENHAILISSIITLIPSVLTFLEPDTGNVIFYLVILFAAIFLKIKNIKPLIMLGTCGLIFLGVFIAFYHFYQSLFIEIFGTSFFYRMDRLVAFLDSSSYQLNNALIGIGSSSWLGHGLSNPIYIPEAITDFAFSLLVTNTGLLGAIGYLVVNFSFNMIIVAHYKNSVGVMKNVIFMFLVMKIVQESIHILMNIGLFPITGITLPFISYGGSSLLSYFILTGLMFSSHMDNMGMDDNMG